MQTWDYLLKQMLWKQLSFVKGMCILDFGSGAGDTAAHLEIYNDVTAVAAGLHMRKMLGRPNLLGSAAKAGVPHGCCMAASHAGVGGTGIYHPTISEYSVFSPSADEEGGCLTEGD